MKSDLIYDVGMHNGEDTAYYLSKGFRVVAIDANPDLVTAAKEKFQTAVAESRLVVIHAAIASELGSATFWVCNELRGLSSFDRDRASSLGHQPTSVQVPTVPLDQIFQAQGVPFYLKVDIEGHDHVAVGAIKNEDAPAYVSMEINSIDDFYLLRQKGYNQFKCIRQGFFDQVLSPRLSFRSILSVETQKIKSSNLANAARKKYRTVVPSSAVPPSDQGWSFTVDSSGPFAEETTGEWQSFEEVLHAWLSQVYGHKWGYHAHPHPEPGRPGPWYDLHAKRT